MIVGESWTHLCNSMYPSVNKAPLHVGAMAQMTSEAVVSKWSVCRTTKSMSWLDKHIS